MTDRDSLRLTECLRLRVQDIDFSRNEITVRHRKGAKDRWKNGKTGEEGRHHVDESILQKAFKQAVGKARTTMIYTHVLNRGGHGVKSPVDTL